MAKSAKHIITIDFPPEVYWRLRQIRKLAGAKTDVITVKNALLVYGWYLSRMRQGFRLHLVKDGVAREIELEFGDGTVHPEKEMVQETSGTF